jgi:hypothetical protein
MKYTTPKDVKSPSESFTDQFEGLGDERYRSNLTQPFHNAAEPQTEF